MESGETLFTDNSIINTETPKESTYDLLELSGIQQIFEYQINFISVHNYKELKVQFIK